MKKIILFVCFVLSFNLQLDAQLELKIDSIEINKNDTVIYKMEINENDTVRTYSLNEFSSHGPHFKLFCSLINNTDSIIHLSLSNTKMYFSFQYDTIPCYYEVFTTEFLGTENQVLLYHDSLSFQIDFWALRFELRDYYYNSEDFDFSKILTTFKLIFSDSLYNLETKNVKKVIFKNY